MNIKFKVMSKTAIAAVIASAAIVPAMAVPAAAATVPVSDVVYSVNGQNTSLELPTFTSATNAGVLTNLDIKYVKSGTGEFFNFNDFTSALNAFDGDTEKAIDALTKSDKKVTVTDVVTGTVDAETGTVVPDTTADEFKVESIAAINETGVTVTFPSLEQGLTDVTVEVVDPNGETVAVVAQDLEEGAEEATFEFETALDVVTPGTWTVGNVTYDVAEPAVLAEEAVAKAEESLLEADVAAAQEVVNALPASSTQSQLNVRLGVVNATIDGIIAKVNNASNDIELYEALNVKPFENVEKANSSKYNEELGKLSDSAKDTLVEIQAVIDAVNKKVIEDGVAGLIQNATEAVGNIPTYVTKNAEEQKVFDEKVELAQAAIDALPADSTDEEGETPKTDLQADLDELVQLNADYRTKVKPVLDADVKGSQFELFEALNEAEFKNVKSANIVEYLEAINDQTIVTEIQYAIDSTNATKAVNALTFEGALATGVTQDTIDAAAELVEILPEDLAGVTTKADLQDKVEAAQGLLDDINKADKALADAKEAVKALADKNGVLVADYDQVIEAEKLVEKVSDVDQKQALTDDINKLVTIVRGDTNLQTAVDAEATTVMLSADVELTTAVTITKSVTIEGNGKKITGPESKEGLSRPDQHALVVKADDVVIKNATVTAPVGFAVQFYEAKGGLLDKVTLTGGDAGLLVNGSEVTVKDVTTSKNAWGGIEVSIGELATSTPKLTVKGTHKHTSPDEGLKPAIWLDEVKVNDGWVVGDLSGYELEAKPKEDTTKDTDQYFFYDKGEYSAVADAKAAVKALLTEDRTALADGVTQSDIDAAKKLVNELRESFFADGEKAALTKDIQDAQEFLHVDNINAAINANDGVALQNTIIKLNVSEFTALSKAARAELAQFIIDNIETPVESTTAFISAISIEETGFVAEYEAAIDAVNNPTPVDKNATQTALNTLNYENFDALTAVQKLDVAEVIYNSVTADGDAKVTFKTIKQITDAIDAAIEAL